MSKRPRALAAALVIVALVGGVALASAVVDQVVVVDSVSASIDVRVAPGHTTSVDIAFRASGGTLANTNQSENAWIEVPATYTIEDDGSIVVNGERAHDNFPVGPSWPYTLTLTVEIDATDAVSGDYNLPLRANVTKGTQISSSPANDATFLAMIPEYIRVRVAETYTVTYHGNTSDGGTAPVDNTLYEAGQTVTVLANTFTKAGHVFDGWNTQADGLGTDRAVGSQFAMGLANVHLHAKWTPVGGGPIDPEDDYPAAPAIATALLNASGVPHRFSTGEVKVNGNGKGKAPEKEVWSNYVSEVARAMGKGASFPAYDAAGNWNGETYVAKAQADAYAAAVRNFLVSLGAAIQ